MTDNTAIIPWRKTADTILVRIRLQPRSSKDAIEGVEQRGGEAFVKARVRAIPEDGAANDALVRLVAAWLGVTKSAVSLAGGGKSRDKTIAIAGELADIERRLAAGLSEIETQKST